MPSHLAAEYVGWAELFVVLAIGTGVIVLAAWPAARRLRSAVWQRTIWQAATVALLGLMATESLGGGGGLVSWLRTLGPPAAAAPEEASQQPPQEVAQDTASPETVAAIAEPVAGADENSFRRFSIPRPRLLARPAPETKRRASPPATRTRPRPSPLTPNPSPLLLVWSLGALLILARTAWARWRLSRVCARPAEAAPLEAGPVVDRIAGRVGLRRRVRLLQYAGLNVPVAFGIVRPTVVLPAGFWDRFSRPEQEAVLAHELAHLAARDPLWHLLAELCCAALWWHPAVWWLRTAPRCQRDGR